MESACIEAFRLNYLFFMGQSAYISGSRDHWQLLNREGYPMSCLAGGGRFYFANLVSTAFSSDLGLCAPSVCSIDEIMWEFVPNLQRRLFTAEPDLQYGVQLREYRGFSLERAWDESEAGALPGVAAVACLAALGWLSGRCAPGSGSEAGDAREALAPLHTLTIFGLAAGEVMRRTRWSSYTWHEANSPLFTFGCSVGELAALALPAVQLLRVAQAVQEVPGEVGVLRRLWAAARALALQGLELAFIALMWVGAAYLVNPFISVNLFAREPWLAPGWTTAMVNCVNAPMRQWLLPLGEAEEAACPHLGAVRAELRLLALGWPVICCAALVGPELACVLILALVAWLPDGVAVPWLSPRIDAALGGKLILVAAAAAILASGAMGRARRAADVAPGTRRRLLRLSWLGLAATASIAYGVVRVAEPGSAVAAYAHASLLPLLLGLAQPLLGAVLAPIGLCHEWRARAAVPALPFLLWIVEGQMEPHAKWFSGYDYFVRTVGVVGLCFTAGAVIDLAWRGLFALMRGAWAALRSSVRLSFEGPDGTIQTAARIPVAALCVPAALLGAHTYGVDLPDVLGAIFMDGAILEPLGAAFSYRGCFLDSETRVLEHLALDDAATPATCHAACSDYAFFGLQAGQYCFCGNGPDLGAQGAEWDCGTPCSSEPSTMCGGDWRNSIYQRRHDPATEGLGPSSAVAGHVAEFAELVALQARSLLGMDAQGLGAALLGKLPFG